MDSQQGCEEDTERMSGGGRGQAAQSRTPGTGRERPGQMPAWGYQGRGPGRQPKGGDRSVQKGETAIGFCNKEVLGELG